MGRAYSQAVWEARCTGSSSQGADASPWNGSTPSPRRAAKRRANHSNQPIWQPRSEEQPRSERIWASGAGSEDGVEEAAWASVGGCISLASSGDLARRGESGRAGGEKEATRR
jgi:hypothetical protein